MNNNFKITSAFVGAIGIGCLLIALSCNKYNWHDPKPYSDPNLNGRYYCNDPDAVNYNWGFPGKPDNTLCVYPTDVFKGKYVFVDSVYSLAGLTSGDFVYQIIDTLYFYPISHTKMFVTGFCGSMLDTIYLTALSFNATIDTLAGDTLTTYQGQIPFCRIKDTVNGTIFYSRIDSLLHFSLQVNSDTGLSSHTGKATLVH